METAENGGFLRRLPLSSNLSLLSSESCRFDLFFKSFHGGGERYRKCGVKTFHSLRLSAWNGSWLSRW